MLRGFIADKADIQALKSIEEAVHHTSEQRHDRGEMRQGSVAGQRPVVLHDGLGAQDPFAFGMGLQGELAKMDLEHGQIIPRSLDQDSPARRMALPFRVAGTLLAAKQGLGLIQAECPDCGR